MLLRRGLPSRSYVLATKAVDRPGRRDSPTSDSPLRDSASQLPRLGAPPIGGRLGELYFITASLRSHLGIPMNPWRKFLFHRLSNPAIVDAGQVNHCLRNFRLHRHSPRRTRLPSSNDPVSSRSSQLEKFRACAQPDGKRSGRRSHDGICGNPRPIHQIR